MNYIVYMARGKVEDVIVTVKADSPEKAKSIALGLARDNLVQWATCSTAEPQVEILKVKKQPDGD